MRIAICDDEKEYLDEASRLFLQYAKDKNIEALIFPFSSPSDLLDRIESGEFFDIYILDIYMPGVSGMSIATELRAAGVQVPIVFLTSSKEHAIEAFGVNATHYLLKPYTKQNFFAALDKTVANMPLVDRTEIVLKSDGGYRSISLDEIVYCEAADNYQRIYMKSGSDFLVRMTSAELYDKIGDTTGFFRCGRRYILSLGHISKIVSSTAVMKNGKSLAVPRSAVAELRTAFFDYFESK